MRARIRSGLTVLLSSRGRMIDREGRGQGTIADGFAPGRYEGASATPAWFWSSTHYGANPLNYPSGVVFRAAALRACLPFRGELGAPADIDLFLRVLCHGDLIVTNTLGCAVMMHAGQEGLKARAGNEVTRQQLALMEVFRPELEAAGAWASVRRQSSALAFAALARTALKEPGLLGDEYRAFGRGAIEMIVAANFLFFLRFLNVFGARFARYLRAVGQTRQR